jgi:hypothetical protein
MPAVDPSANALTTVDALMTYMSEPSIDASGKQHDRAQLLINAYSTAIVKYLKRQFKPLEAAADKVFSYDGAGYLSLAPWEATAIHTVTMYTDMPTTNWVVLDNQSSTTAAGYRVNPRSKTSEGTYWSLTLPELGRFHPYLELTPWPPSNLGYEVTVNADWGVAATDFPDDVELACWIACANAWTNPGARRATSRGSDYESYVPGTEDGLSLPRAARALLSPYRRRGTSIR